MVPPPPPGGVPAVILACAMTLTVLMSVPLGIVIVYVVEDVVEDVLNRVVGVDPIFPTSESVMLPVPAPGAVEAVTFKVTDEPITVAGNPRNVQTPLDA